MVDSEPTRQTLTVEHTPLEHLQSQKAVMRLTQRQILELLKEPPFRLSVSIDKVNHLLTGRLPLGHAAVHSPHVVAGLLIVLGIRDIRRVGLDPEEAAILHWLMRGYYGGPGRPGAALSTYTYRLADQLVTARVA